MIINLQLCFVVTSAVFLHCVEGGWREGSVAAVQAWGSEIRPLASMPKLSMATDICNHRTGDLERRQAPLYPPPSLLATLLANQ